MDSPPKTDDAELTAEQRLAQERAVMWYIVDNIPYFIFWKDRESRFLGCNKNFAALAGSPDPKGVIGKTDYDMVWHEEAEHFQSADRDVMRRGEPLLDHEEPLTRPDGTKGVLLTSKVPLRDERGEVVGILGIFTDITKRKQL